MGLGGFTDEIATIDMDKSAAAMMSASQQSLDSMTASMTQSMTSATFSSQQFQQHQQFHASSTSLESAGYASMTASQQSLSQSSMTQSSQSHTQSSQQSSMTAVQTSSSTSSSTIQSVERQAIQAATVVEQQAIAVEQESLQTAAAIEQKIIEPTVVKSAVTQVVSKPNVIVKETIHLFAGTLSYSTRSASHVTYEEVLPPVHLKDGWIYVEEEGILAVRQFDFAPSPVKEIQLYTSCTVDPPVEFAIPVVKKATHTTAASLITIEKGELKLVREEIEEDEGMFEEFWEEVRTEHYEEEQRRILHRRKMMEERIEETRRIQERRQMLLKRIEETKGIYAYSARRSSNMSMDSPASYRTMDSFGSVTYSPR